MVIKMLPKHKWLELLNDKWKQQMAYSTGRDMVEDVTGGEKNACAAVCCIWHILRGTIDKVVWNTKDVLNLLRAAGYQDVGDQKGWHTIRPGDVAFSEDANNNNIPDHVYIILGIPDSTGHCLVLDNYHPYPHRRNLLKGKRTPLAFFLRCDATPTKRLDTWRLRVVLMGFRWLYSQFSHLPLYLQEQLNTLRHDVFFNSK